MSKISLKASSTRLSLQRLNLPTSKRKSNHLLDFRGKWPKEDSKLKPFRFCCSLDRFDPLSRYNQRKPPFKSSLTAITSVNECPVAKMQMKFSMSRFFREKKKPAKTRTSDVGEQQRLLKNGELSYFQISRNNRFIRQYLEDEIALAKDIFWAEKQKIHKETSNKAIKIARKKSKKHLLKLKKYPRWYQDFSPDQMKHIMKLENVMLTDYEETKTNGTQTTLIAIGVTSTLFKLKPSTIKELYKSCKLNSVDFLREIYRILTGNDFCEEGYKKVYDCNERIILSAIAFLTLPETIKELHKRLPTVIMPKLPLKPKLITCLARRKDSCPYKEELFKRPDWTGYRNALQKWQKHCKLTAIPKIILPLNKYDPFFMNNRSEFKKQRKNISTEHLEEISTKELQTISPTMYEKDSSRERPLESTNFNILQPPDDSKKSSFRILSKKPETAEYKIYGPPKPSGAGKKSWLGKKDAHYIIAGISTKDSHSYPVTYENAGVANVTPSNSDEKFFAVLKFGDQTKKIFPSGRENLSIKWQEWLQNANESYKQLEEETDELIKNVQATIKSAFPGPFCDSCCSCRQTRKFEEQLQQSKINKALIDGEKNLYITNSMAMQSSGPNPTDVSINLVVEDEIRTNILHPIKNVPPCSCPIQQMVDKDVSLCISKEIIPWTKEGLCPGKKYRPKEPGAYSCKMYPGDEFCKYNPFTKEIMKMERRKIQKEKEKEGEEERVKEKTKLIEAVKKEIQVPETDIIEKKIDKFIPDPDYPAYDNPWNISRTAPPAKIIKTDYEATLKLTSPEWPTTSYLPLKMQENQNNIFSKELSHTSVKKETSKVIMGLQSFNKMTSSKIGHRRDVSHKETTDKIISKNKYSEEIIDEIDYQQNESHKQIKKTKENIDDKSHRINGDKKYVNKFNQLIAIIKVELKKMAAEGYTFAKLPKCYLMPQLQDWVMYRQGVVFSETDKKNLMEKTRTIWDITSRKMLKDIEKPSLHMTKHQLRRLTFDQAERIKKKIEKIKEIFHSEVRKTRVAYARTMWSTMEYGKFPSTSFKRTFFTYMASKEADGHVYKPWLPSEIRRDLNFCCY